MDSFEIRNWFEDACEKIDTAANYEDALDMHLSSLVSYINKFPDHKNVFLELLIAGLDGAGVPNEVLEYSFHALKWEELKIALIKRRSEWLGKPRTMFYWQQLMNAFDEDWEDLDMYPSLQRTDLQKSDNTD